MFKLIAVTDQASCPENFWTQLQLLAASEIDALIFRAKELPPQEYYRQASQVQKICRTHQLPLILHTYQDICRRLDTYGLQVSYQQLLFQPQLRAQVQCLGVSIHHADEAVRAADLGADYLLQTASRGCPDAVLIFSAPSAPLQPCPSTLSAESLLPISDRSKKQAPPAPA